VELLLKEFATHVENVTTTATGIIATRQRCGVGVSDSKRHRQQHRRARGEAHAARRRDVVSTPIAGDDGELYGHVERIVHAHRLSVCLCVRL
jgi:hypothetical protein